MADEIDEQRNRFADQFRQRAIESAAVIISGLSLLVSVICAVVAVLSLFIAVQANRNNVVLQGKHDVTQIYVRDLKAYLIQQGFKPPEEE